MLNQFNYFTEKELLRNWQVPEVLLKNIIPTATILDYLRHIYGKPITILSTYRSEKYNKKVGGVKNSLHLVFNAIDFTVANKEDLKYLYNELNRLDSITNKFLFLPKSAYNFGLGYYGTFIHFDTRSYLGRQAPKRWYG